MKLPLTHGKFHDFIRDVTCYLLIFTRVPKFANVASLFKITVILGELNKIVHMFNLAEVKLLRTSTAPLDSWTNGHHC